MATEPVREGRFGGAASGRAFLPAVDETKASLKTTEFWAMILVILAILVASAVSDSLGDVRAWTLVAAVAIGYMLSRGLAKSGSKYTGGEDILGGGNPVRGIDR
jgi:hypothetical protein